MATFTDSIVERLIVTDVTVGHVAAIITETANFTSDVTNADITKFALITETFNAEGVASPAGALGLKLASSLQLTNSMVSTIQAALAESLNVADAQTLSAYSTIASGFALASTASGTAVRAPAVITENVAFTDRLRPVLVLDVSSSFNVMDAMASSIKAALVESVAFTDSSGAGSMRNAMLASSFAIRDSMLSSVAATLVLKSGLNVVDFAYFDDVANPAFWSNANTLAAGLWKGVPFESYALHADQLIACGPDGIYLLDGDGAEVNPIAVLVQGDLMDLGSEQKKVFEAVYVSAKCGGPLLVTVENEMGSYQYPTHLTAGSTYPTTHRAPVGRGLTGRYVRVSLDNLTPGFEGVDLNVNDVKLRVGDTWRVR